MFTNLYRHTDAICCEKCRLTFTPEKVTFKKFESNFEKNKKNKKKKRRIGKFTSNNFCITRLDLKYTNIQDATLKEGEEYNDRTKSYKR